MFSFSLSTILVTVILVVLTGLLFLGKSIIDQGPKFEGVTEEDAEERIPGIPPFEPKTVADFLNAAITGQMPGGVKSALPLLPKNEMVHFTTKYKDWAPEPWSNLPGPISDFGPAGPESPAPIIRMMHHVTGLGNIFSMGNEPITLERSDVSMQHKIWFGLVPVSDCRWQARDLDNPANIEEAINTIENVVSIFEYLSYPEIQGNKIRGIHNKLWVEIDTFQDAINALYVARGDAPPEFHLTRLWEEYMRCHFLFMESQARAWVFRRHKILYSCFKERLLATFQSGREINDTQMTVKIDHWDLMVLNALLDLYEEADIYIRLRVDGLITKSAPMDPRFIGIVGQPDKAINKVYDKVETQRLKTVDKMLRSATKQRAAHRRKTNPMPAFMEPVNERFDREFTYKELQPEIENPRTLKAEPWVQALLSRFDSKADDLDDFGFVIYRVSYSETNEQWVEFLTKFREGLNSGWDGYVDAEKIMGKATLQWVDGRDANIAEGDIEAIRQHAKNLATHVKTIKTVCLAVTPDSVKSFTQVTTGESMNEHRGFVTAVDTSFNTTQPNAHPGYLGSVKFIDQLIWTDLYAMHIYLSCQQLPDYWNLARAHPEGIYVGPTTGVCRRNWRRSKEEKAAADQSMIVEE